MNCEVINLQHLPSNQRQTISSHCSIEIAFEMNGAKTSQILNCLNCCEFQRRVQVQPQCTNTTNRISPQYMGASQTCCGPHLKWTWVWPGIQFTFPIKFSWTVQPFNQLLGSFFFLNGFVLAIKRPEIRRSSVMVHKILPSFPVENDGKQWKTAENGWKQSKEV